MIFGFFVRCTIMVLVVAARCLIAKLGPFGIKERRSYRWETLDFRGVRPSAGCQIDAANGRATYLPGGGVVKVSWY